MHCFSNMFGLFLEIFREAYKIKQDLYNLLPLTGKGGVIQSPECDLPRSSLLNFLR